jgi:hypothetical protein
MLAFVPAAGWGASTAVSFLLLLLLGVVFESFFLTPFLLIIGVE